MYKNLCKSAVQLGGFSPSEHTCVTTSPLTKFDVIYMWRPSSYLLLVTSPHSPKGDLYLHFFHDSTVLPVSKLLMNRILEYALLSVWLLFLSLSWDSSTLLWEAIVGSFSSLMTFCCMNVSYTFNMSFGLF